MTKNNWKKCKLKEVAEIIGGGTPDTKETLFWGGDIPWLTPKDLSNYYGRYISNGERYITKLGLENSSAKILPKESVLLTSRAPIGYIAIAKNSVTTNQGFKSLVLKKGHYSLFYYYLLKANIEYIQNMGSGSTFKEISGSVVKELTFLVPEYEEQKRIAEILGAFDDKIELLQKQNKTLEEIAKAIFKSWFVDFDIVKAKINLEKSKYNNLSPSLICHPCGESAPMGQKGVKQNGVKNEKLPYIITTPTQSNDATSPTMWEYKGTSHQIYVKHIKNLVRAMRKHLTPQEVKLWQHIRKKQLGVKFRRQFPIDSKYIADFACIEKKLIIELDGSQHADSLSDKIRTLYLEDNGFNVLRFWNNEIDKNLTGCLDRIIDFLNQSPLPACGGLSPQGGQIKTKEDIIRNYHLTEELYNLFPSSFVDSSLGPIPTGWKVKNVDSLCERCQSGGTPSTKHEEYWENGTISWFSTKELQDTFLVNSEKNITQMGLKNSSAKLFPKGTIVMAIYASPTVGRLGILTKESTFNQAAVGFTPNEEMISKEYLFLLLKQRRDDLNNLANGVAQQNLSVGVVIVEESQLFG